MPGLLDSFFGTPEQTQMLGLLGAGLARRDAPGGFLAAQQYAAGAQDRALKQQYMQAQAANLASEIDARKLKTVQDQRQQKLMESFFPGIYGSSAPATPGAAPMAPGAPATPGMPAAGGMPGSAPAGDNGILAVAKQYGIPPQAIQADIVFNGGKKIAELLDKHGSPDMQVSNGYAFDKNRVGAGYLPQLNVSQNGQSSMVRIGPDGLPVMSAPQGALETYSNYRNADEAAKAGQDLVKVVGPDGAERYVTRTQAVNATQPQPQPRQMAPQAGVTGGFTGNPDQVSAAIDSIADPQERANARAAFEEQARRTPGFGQGGPFQASQTTAQATNAAAQKEQAVQTAKDVAAQRSGIVNAGFVAPTNIAKYQQIGKLLQDVDGGTLTATGTNLASLANSLGVKIDKNLPNKQAAMSLANEAALQLRSPAGGAGMPGAMSDQDRAFLASMTPNMSQTAEGRKMVIDAYVSVQQRNQQVAAFLRKYEQKYGRLDNGFFDQLQAWSSAHPLFKAQ